MMRRARHARMIDDMTVGEHIEQNSFAYCDELPPDVAEGLPLRAARSPRPVQHTTIKRALKTCVRVVGRKR
jgi:hypothetical protein